jgi:ubiquinone/menaquinone biosynthesis C-methylase UbiE
LIRMDDETLKSKVVDTFNAVSAGYDNRSLRFFSESAKHMARYMDDPDIRRVLDVATGTGRRKRKASRMRNFSKWTCMR